jgi:hypothetical protein
MFYQILVVLSDLQEHDANALIFVINFTYIHEHGSNIDKLSVDIIYIEIANMMS